ncbi:MAG TPA: DNA replication/repair protein RecF [Alphaproteobacteria bacterium]|nr:DNA replication/repair protein RecF [Alphaproteobacteria bacterium]
MQAERLTNHHPLTTHHSAIHRLSLEAFRNYDRLVLDIAPAPVVLVGENGAGKTSLLEALSLLNPGRGLRGATLSELQNHLLPATPWAVSAQIDGRRGAAQIGVGADPEAPRESRTLRIDGKAGKSSSALLEHLAVLWITPDMDRLLSESMSERRRFMDRLVFVLNPQHRARVSRYEEAMRQRLRLLREGPADAAWLNALEDQMAKEGIAIAAARKDWCERLSRHLPANPAPFPLLHVHVEGVAESLMENHSALDAEEALRARFKQSRGEDAASGTTECGPHRSDLRSFHGGTGLTANLCSSGEQKALLISLILAQARLLQSLQGMVPLLLLDDITAHLDEARREALGHHLLDMGAQAWLSGTDAGFFDALQGHAQFFHIDHGYARLMSAS